MNQYETFIIAFLDIFKSIITNSEAAKALRRAIEDDDTSPEGEGYKRYNESLKKAKIHIMSDSIVVATPGFGILNRWQFLFSLVFPIYVGKFARHV